MYSHPYNVLHVHTHKYINKGIIKWKKFEKSYSFALESYALLLIGSNS